MFNSQMHLSSPNRPTDTQRGAGQFFIRAPSALFQDRSIRHHETQPRKVMRLYADNTETSRATQAQLLVVKRRGVKIGHTGSYLTSILADSCPFNLENRLQVIPTVTRSGQNGINSVVSPSGQFNKSSRSANDNWPLGQNDDCVCTEQVQEQGNRMM